MSSYFSLIIGMMLVTYLPRLLPLLALSDLALPPMLRRFFLYIPYTALGALIVRGVLEGSAAMFWPTLAAIGVAALCSWWHGGLVASVGAAIGAAYLLLASE